VKDEPRQEHDPEGLRELVDEIAGQIADDLAQTEAGAGLLAARRKCPQGKLCCFKGYRCSDFWCEGGFRCLNDFSHLQRAVDHRPTL
jgi:hypothetical protein